MAKVGMEDASSGLFPKPTDAQPPHYHGHRDRLRERFLSAGAEKLPDYEVLELLLFGVIPRKDTKPIAKALLAKFGGFDEVLAANPEALMQVDGIKESAAAMLKAVLQARIRAQHLALLSDKKQ
ncbi:MAG: UPF0758 domain-containing protein [Rhodospirillaceae bacterium]